MREQALLEQQSLDYRRIEQAILYLGENFSSQPSLEEIAGAVSVSKYHFQRLFKRWAGVSPQQFLRFLTLEYTKERLSEGQSILEASYEAGLSGPGRLHDLFVSYEAMTPGEFKQRGEGLKIIYGLHPTPFGECLVGTTERGICSLDFIGSEGRDETVSRMKSGWASADFQERPEQTAPLVEKIFPLLPPSGANAPFHLLLRGTNFQVKVWQALLSIPSGVLVSYKDIAAYIGKPSAVRAVAGAVAVNPIAYLIPCHRVISNSGRIHQYHWGSVRKKVLLGWEAAHRGG
jgi:AraC family transcriptional regulator, regulatory protein of adaptative response / methylated-DNA-[protein]-cysteine methyltransferase